MTKPIAQMALVIASLLFLAAVAGSVSFSAPKATTGSTSTSIALNQGHSLLYIANERANEVSVIDATTLKVQAPVVVRADVREIALDYTHKGDYVYVTDVGEDNLIAVDAHTGRVLGTYPTGKGAMGLVTKPGGGYVYVVNSLDHSISIVDSHDHKELNRNFLHKGTFSLGEQPLFAAFTPDLRLWYTDAKTNTVGVVGVNATVAEVAPWVVAVNVTTLGQIGLTSTPSHIVATYDGSEVIVGIENGLVLINASTYETIASITLAETPSSLASSPGGYYLAAVPRGVYVIDARNLNLTFIKMNGGAYGLALSPDGETLYVSNPQSGTVTVVDMQELQIAETIYVGGTPMGLALLSSIEGKPPAAAPFTGFMSTVSQVFFMKSEVDWT